MENVWSEIEEGNISEPSEDSEHYRFVNIVKNAGKENLSMQL